MPSTEQEVWRYSRIAELDLDAYAPVTGAGAPNGPIPVPDVGPTAATVVVRNGHVVSVDVTATGVEVGHLRDLDPDGESLGAIAGDPADKLDLLHDAHAADPVLVRVARGTTVPDP